MVNGVITRNRRLVIISPTFGSSPLEKMIRLNRKGNYYTFSECFHSKNLRHHPLFFLNELLPRHASIEVSASVAKVGPRNILPAVCKHDGVLGLPGCTLWKQLASSGEKDMIILLNRAYSSVDSEEFKRVHEELKNVISAALWLKRTLRETESIYYALVAIEAEFVKFAQDYPAYKASIMEKKPAVTIIEFDYNEPMHRTKTKLSKALGISSAEILLPNGAQLDDVKILALIQKDIRKKTFKVIFFGVAAAILMLFFILQNYFGSNSSGEKANAE